MSKRLDRAIVCCDWRVIFPEVHVENLSRLHLGHSPMLVWCEGSDLTKKDRPFRFQAACTTH